MNWLVMIVAATAFATAAHAQSIDPNVGPQTLRITVSSPDLDLSTDAGARTLLRRLQLAAGTVCGKRPSFGVALLARTEAWKACRA